MAVDPPHRGNRISSRITAQLATISGALFARTSNAKMKSALKGVGFVERGAAWKGHCGDMISLWIRS